MSCMATCAVRGGQASGLELRRAWASFKRLEEAGRGSSASRALESSCLNTLYLASEGGLVPGSEEMEQSIKRRKELAHLLGGQAEGARTASKEAMDAEFGLIIAACFAGWTCENAVGSNGRMTPEKVGQAHKHLSESAARHLTAELLAPDDASAMYMRSGHAALTVFEPRQHALAAFNPVAQFGEGGARVRDIIER